jgi:hypothetical protein
MLFDADTRIVIVPFVAPVDTVMAASAVFAFACELVKDNCVLPLPKL